MISLTVGICADVPRKLILTFDAIIYRKKIPLIKFLKASASFNTPRNRPAKKKANALIL